VLVHSNSNKWSPTKFPTYTSQVRFLPQKFGWSRRMCTKTLKAPSSQVPASKNSRGPLTTDCSKSTREVEESVTVVLLKALKAHCVSVLRIFIIYVEVSFRSQLRLRASFRIFSSWSNVFHKRAAHPSESLTKTITPSLQAYYTVSRYYY